jgi:TPR repeat protein
VAACAGPAPLEDSLRLGERHYLEDDYGAALPHLREAAEQGRAEAQFLLGLMSERGQGVPQDDGQAADWYGRAAEQGHAGAMNRLGMLHRAGRGVPEDLVRAAELFRAAAKAGHADAQFNLGLAYETGEGVPKDLYLAVRWYAKAARQDDRRAIRKLRYYGVVFGPATSHLPEDDPVSPDDGRLEDGRPTPGGD